MSCCIIKKDTSSSVEELNKLTKHFDEVLLEKKEKYQLLTLRDKANKSNYDYIVWLEVKVSYGFKEGHNARTDEYMLSGVCKSILDWIDILKNFEKSDAGKQLSLFDDGSDDELELEPIAPRGEGNWSGYFKKREEVNKRNLMKKYSFFELLSIEYFTYSGIDYRKQLPSIENIRELLKQAILKSKDSPGRYNDFWFDTPAYLTRDGALSDIELVNRLRSVRLFLIPYTSYFRVSTDLSYSSFSLNENISHRYYLDGTKLSTCGSHDNDTLDLPTYDGLYNAELLEWVRNVMNIPCKEVISDDDVLRENIENFMWRLIGSENAKVFDFKNKINTFKDWKQFKANITSLIPRGNNGGGSGYSIDGFSGGYSIDGKGNIKITQNYEQRIELNRNVDGLEIDDHRDSNVLVFNISGDEIYKEAFRLFSKKAVIQTSLFDFLAA
ncbi:hypothetical protein SAMN06314019_1106 [Epsilonproteobacteria bacterium SCGC AD-311-C15]|jgi:hypothetical protein|nr:hypothetical protein SAMN06314019_1106 [Epsilonproteobacteria bacterium SCGC AD-311-C15]